MLFSSEQVSNGHPDKICDQISDAIVSDILAHDKKARVAAEVCIKDYDIVILGEITSSYIPDYKNLVQGVLQKIGLKEVEKYKIQELISAQSPDIALGVDHDGAGDQGMMFGYATRESEEMLPLPYVLSTRALQKLRAFNLENDFSLLKPDAKSQVSFDYSAHRIDTFLLSTQHDEKVSLKEVRAIVERIMQETAEELNLNTDFHILVNPTGRFVPIDRTALSQCEFSLRLNGEEKLKGHGNALPQNADCLIAQISHYHTVRNGDLILLGTPPSHLLLGPEGRVETYLNDECVLSFKIK